MQIDEAFVDSQAPNAAAIKNARGVVIKRKLAGLFRSADGTLLFGDCKGSGAENYRPSADFSDPAKPVYRCTCPSHQFPCKHSLALLYAFAQGMKFVEKEVPVDILEKRVKIQQRVEKKREEADKPRQVNTSALKKKIQTQREGLSLLESLVNDLVRAGLGTLNSKSARQIEEQARQLGNAYLPGAQNALHALTGLFYRSQISSEGELKSSELWLHAQQTAGADRRCFKKAGFEGSGGSIGNQEGKAGRISFGGRGVNVLLIDRKSVV